LNYPPLEVKVWGNMACFTRPEMKVERVTYEVMTPSAARGILEAIYWKPQMQWQIRAIRVLCPIRHISLLRNEVKSRAVVETARKWERQGGGYYADEDRTQRHTLALRDVAYIIVADALPAPGVTEDPAKFRDQFRRRVLRGQCHRMPYLGCREFSAAFAAPQGNEQPQNITADLGMMLLDLDYRPDSSGRGKPRFFWARLEEGVLSIPEHLSRVDGGSTRHALTATE
jgi:CRISPR-associated protein Cas5d